jgi:GTP-binding protein Era
LKRIGSAARKEIEAMSGRKVYLELRVKVEKDWRDDENALRRFGYKIEKRRK